MSERAGLVNAYICEGDGRHATWTRNADTGTTPFVIRCPAPECGAEALSQGYRVSQDVDVSHEWYRPTKDRGLTPGERRHVLLGGLLLRQITPIPVADVPPTQPAMPPTRRELP